MKIHMQANATPRQFANVAVTCKDSVMVEMLNLVSTNFRFNVSDVKKSRDGGGFSFFMFESGAKLCAGKKRDEFCIFGYAYDGRDTRAAALELQYLEALRNAQRRRDALDKALGHGKHKLKLDME